jgi:GT2 family glycosyltransferase
MEAATNSGLAATDSEFCALLDDDDTWAPDFLEAMLKSCARATNGVVCQTTLVLEHFEGDRLVEDARRPFNPDLSVLSLPRLAVRNRFTSNAFLFRRSLAEAVGGFDETLPVLGDWDFNLRCLLHGALPVLPRELARYHQRPAERGVSGNSVFARSDEHARARAQLVNKLLRMGTPQTTALALLVDAGERLERLDELLGRLERVMGLPRRVSRLLRGVDSP